ncbi:MAG: DUF6502 family protein [Polaromonas sp.]|nr:DUF6502 family protein [Polaromonas sp.]
MSQMNPPAQPNEATLPKAGLPQPALAAQALAQLLRPLARLMIDHGVQLTALQDPLKLALVEEALGTYGLNDKASSDTRVALLTGVHRKDVRRLRKAPQASQDNKPMLPVAAAVVARWISDPQYLHTDQSTRGLARTPKHGQRGEPDFTSLVAEISTDVGARAVLDELVRLGVVSLQGESHVVLNHSAFVPREGLVESFHFLASNVSDHFAVAVHNLAPDRRMPPMLEQSAFCADLSAEQAEQLQARARQLWAGTVQQFLQTATVAEQRSQHDIGPKHRVRFGVYFYDAAQDPPIAVQPKSVRKNSRKTKP